MYRRESPEPSDRNREIYEAVRYDRKKQKELAEKHGLSQPMISKIVSQYEEWLVAHAPNENFAGYEREFLAANAWCERLTQGGHMAQEGYEASCVDRLLPEKEGVRGRWVPARPDMRAIKTMTDCAEKFVTATKARESARHLIIAERDRDPQYQAEQARLRREESQRRVAAQQQPNREAAERANGNVVVTLRRDDISGVTTPLADAKPALGAGDVRPAERADDNSTTAAFAPLTNADQAVIKMGGERENAAENGASKRLYDFPDSKSPAADLTPQCESVADAEPALGAGDVRTTQRAEDNVVVTLRRDDISGVTTPLADAKPALGAGDVRTTERADDIIYFARERKAPPGYAPVDVNEWHGLEPPPDAILKWRDDYPHLAPMVCNSSGELINCIYLCDVADPVQAELDRAAGTKPEQLYCWLSSREINERPGGAIIPYARQLWRERGYSRRHLEARSASEGRPPAPPTTTAPTSKDRMMADRMIPPRTEHRAPTSTSLPTAAPRLRVGLKETPAPPTTTAPTSKDRMMSDRKMPPRTEQQASTSAALPAAAPRSRVGLKKHRRATRRTPKPPPLDFRALQDAAVVTESQPVVRSPAATP